MRKTISVVLAFLILVLFSVSSFAETIDLSQISNDDLVQLYQNIQSEFVNRGMEKSAHLPAGRYMVGKDIPVGTYIIKVRTGNKSSGIIAIYDETLIKEDDHLILYEFTSKNTEIDYRYELKEGYMLDLPFEVEIIMSNGIVFQ